KIVREQIAVLSRNFPIAAAKTGLLFSAEIVEAVARALVDLSGRFVNRVPLVIDPVTVATSGDLLLRPDAIALYESELFPLAALLTPNLFEAETLGREAIRALMGMCQAGWKIQQQLV